MAHDRWRWRRHTAAAQVISPGRHAFLASIGILAGCGTLPHDRHWGGDATAVPGWQRVTASARHAAADPRVWIPLLGAAAFQVDEFDRRASDWAREHMPVFGSQLRAERWSDHLRDASAYTHYATIVATRSGDAVRPWLANKAGGALVDAGAVATTVAITRGLKTTFGRDRPNGQGTESFPSGHTSSSAVHTALASRNLEFVPLRAAVRDAADAGLYAMTLGTSWARVEAGWHYPSDTLFSMALGRFLATWFNDAFLDPDRVSRRWTVVIYPRADLYPACGRVNKYC